ncbi:MAG: fibronectin type III domain-containing protein, partial [Thermoguttaceae bacterium]|nr:fibronectin type III domain-containing protein [Thermoguttaceae bacterium]
SYNDRPYFFRVRAENATGVSEWTTAKFTPTAKSSALLTSEAFANAFDELDFFVDEDDLDALAKRLV